MPEKQGIVLLRRSASVTGTADRPTPLHKCLPPKRQLPRGMSVQLSTKRDMQQNPYVRVISH
jgi:hypothetical protein